MGKAGRPRTGHLECRNGVWYAQLSVGKAPKGQKARRDWFCMGTADETLAGRKMQRLMLDIEDGKFPTDDGPAPNCERVDDYAAAFFAKREAQGLVMARDEQGYFERYARKTIGGMYLCDVRPPHVQAILDQALAAGRKRETVVKIRGVLHRVFKAAWRAELIDSNPVARAEVPKVRETRKQRCILNDGEFAAFMASEAADLEIKLMALVSRTLGGMRTGDVIAWDWSMVDRVHFAEAFIPRSKTNTPDRLEVPEMLRPFLRARWEVRGEPETGPVFPVERGRRAGEARMPRAQSFAGRLRRNLLAAGVVRMPPGEVRKTIHIGHTKTKRDVMVPVPNPLDPLFNETATTLPVDFHSFRRAFSTALAEAGVNAQQAMLLAHHSDSKVHMRYVQQTAAMRRIPEAALPMLTVGKPIEADRVFPPGRGNSDGSSCNQAKTQEHDGRSESAPLSQKALENALFSQLLSRGSRVRVAAGVLKTSESRTVPANIPTLWENSAPGTPDVPGSTDPAAPLGREARRAALTRALAVAAEAGDNETVATLAAELRALRLEDAGNVVDVADRMRKR